MLHGSKNSDASVVDGGNDNLPSEKEASVHCDSNINVDVEPSIKQEVV